MTATNIFVNFPTTDLDRAKAFYEALGYRINPNFTDENAACVVLDDNLYFMVLTREFLGTFTDKQIIDTKTHAQMAVSLTCESREAVDEMLERLGLGVAVVVHQPEVVGTQLVRSLHSGGEAAGTAGVLLEARDVAFERRSARRERIERFRLLRTGGTAEPDIDGERGGRNGESDCSGSTHRRSYCAATYLPTGFGKLNGGR